VKRFVYGVVLLVFLVTGFACNTNKPADEVLDARERVKDKVDEGRERQQQEPKEEDSANQ